MLSFRKRIVAAGAAVAAAISVAGTPVYASLTLNSLTHNALTHNALAAGGSAIDDLNGVAVEAATIPCCAEVVCLADNRQTRR